MPSSSLRRRPMSTPILSRSPIFLPCGLFRRQFGCEIEKLLTILPEVSLTGDQHEVIRRRITNEKAHGRLGGEPAATRAALWRLPLAAQEKFPSKTVEIVTHSGAGGGTDITARMMMVHAPEAFGTEFAVANRVGGSGAAALAYAAGKPRDGPTVLLITQSHLLTIMQGKATVKYEDLVGVARATSDPQVLMVGQSSPLTNEPALLSDR